MLFTWLLLSEGVGSAVGSLRHVRITPVGDRDYIYLGNDWRMDYIIEERDSALRWQPVLGLTGISRGIALSPTGQILAGTQVELTQPDLTQPIYRAVNDRAAIDTALSSYVDLEVFPVLDDGADLRRVERRVVKRVQYI